MCECCDFIAEQGGDPSDPAMVARYTRVWRARTRATVREHGLAVQCVEGAPGWAYTIGLWRLGHPELVVFGLPPHTASAVLEVVGGEISDGLIAIDEGFGLEVGAWEFRAVRVPSPSDVVALANTYFRRRPRQSVPALQLVYPDVHGVWPGQAGCHLSPAEQPVPRGFVA